MQKELADKLVEECTETVEEAKLAKIISAQNESVGKCSSWKLYIVLFSVILTVIVGIGTYFVYSHWYSKKHATRVKFGTHTQTIF